MTTAAPTVAVGAFIFDADDRVLLIERGRPPGLGQWTIPGGRVELGESLAAAVVREVREETGLLVEVGALVEVVERVTPADAPAGALYHYVILDYVARVIGGALAASSDARAARFVAEAELPHLPLTDGLLPVLARARASR